ncbi:MAG: homocysteine S-methyltransferase family protein [Oscillospiraceae bacterium]|nr:homocysteine S-methyltransferase family protein [Oscillospiraceae bacterium]
MGTMLQRHGLRGGELPELHNLTHPGTVKEIHRAYLEAGSQILYTNTFGASARKLASAGHTPEEVISAAVAIAHQAADDRSALVALDIGPIGALMTPAGDLSFDEAYDLFAQQAAAGAAAGADLIVIETMSDLQEARAALLAAKEQTSLPVFVTMSFEENGRTFTGTSAEAMAEVLSGLGADAIGVNCSLGPVQLIPIVRRIGALTRLPLIVKANAGLPDARTGRYDMGAQAWADAMLACADAGVQFIGGCCGTTPEYLSALRIGMNGKQRAAREFDGRSRVASAEDCLTLDRVAVIGERINPTGKKRFQQALRDGDLDYVCQQAVSQEDAGADILDVNVGAPGVEEAVMMARVVDALQSATSLPLQIDSGNPQAVEAGLRRFPGKAIVNSVDGTAASQASIFPLVKKYGAALVCLTTDENGIPPKAEDRFAIAQRIVSAARAAGIEERNLFIDCLTLTVSAQQDAAAETLRAVEMVHRNLGLHTVLGVSNISFGLPNRELLNRSFLAMALHSGLDLPILNPNLGAMMDTVAAYNVLSGADAGCVSYLERESTAEQASAPAQAVLDLGAAIEKGLAAEAKTLAAEKIRTAPCLDVIDQDLVPALDRVGKGYESGRLFLPQLLRAADAASAVFEVLREKMAADGMTADKGTIVLATVQGDVHDIGKNIVKALLSNYGYRVVDLGKDVPPEEVVRTAIAENAPLVGLSALMTTTLPSMERTIQALRASGHPCTIMVGGAVLTPEYASQIGADYYAKDAQQSVKIAQTVFGR